MTVAKREHLDPTLAAAVPPLMKLAGSNANSMPTENQTGPMATTVEELASRLNADAARRHISADELLDIVVAQCLDRSEPTDRFAFIPAVRCVRRGDQKAR